MNELPDVYMLDSDLATIYGYTTRHLSRIVVSAGVIMNETICPGEYKTCQK